MIDIKFTLLKDISNIQTGYALRGKLPEDPNGSISILQMKDVQPEGIEWKKLAKISPTGRKPPYYLQPEDVVFCGRGTRIFAVPVLIQPENVVAGQQFFVVTPRQGIPAEYIAWFINSKHGQKYFWTNAGGSSIINVTREVLENCPVHLPSDKNLMNITELIRAMNLESRIITSLKTRRQELLEGIISEGMEEAIDPNSH
jgi:hypothetical protein